MKSLSILLESLLNDYSRLLPGVKGLDRDLITLNARLKDEGIGFLTVALPSFGKAFDKGLEERRFTCPLGFTRRGAIPVLFQGMLCNVFDSTTGLLLEDASPEYIKCIRELLFFFKKFTPCDDRRALLEKRAFREFVNLDKSILSIAPFRLDKIARVSKFILLELDQFQELKCKHGPGAVAENVKSNQKWSFFTSRLLDGDELLSTSGYDTTEMLYRNRYDESFSNIPRSTDCRLVAVPKTSSSLRTITVEPCLNQFVQQGYNEHLRRSIERCKILQRCLSLTDQSKNQELALTGSRDGTWVTMDLSSASDLLSLELVKTVFSNRPRFLSGILSCRTPSVIVNNVVHDLRKYAGMGNATTFPIQSTVFAIIALTAIVGDERLSIRKLAAYASCIRVYGDDIIVKREYYPRVAEWISSCGLKINRGKTFSNGNFRESCGVDAYSGINVTPIYLRCDPDLASTDANAFASVISTSNQLWLNGRYSVANAILGIVRKRLPLVRSTAGCIGLHTRQEVTTFQRWNRDLQCFEFKAPVLQSLRRKDQLDGVSALMKFFHTPAIAEYDRHHLDSSVLRFHVKSKMRWLSS